VKRTYSEISRDPPTEENYLFQCIGEVQEFVPLNPNTNINTAILKDQMCSEAQVRGAIGVTNPMREVHIIITDLGAKPPDDMVHCKNVIDWMPTLHLLMMLMKLVMKFLQQMDGEKYSKIIDLFGYHGFSQDGLIDGTDTHKV
jgi:hypothetical protein